MLIEVNTFCNTFLTAKLDVNLFTFNVEIYDTRSVF